MKQRARRKRNLTQKQVKQVEKIAQEPVSKEVKEARIVQSLHDSNLAKQTPGSSSKAATRSKRKAKNTVINSAEFIASLPKREETRVLDRQFQRNLPKSYSNLTRAGKNYFRVLMNPAAAALSKIEPKYPDKYADATHGWYSHIDLNDVPTMKNWNDLAGPDVIEDYGNGSISYYATPSLITPLKVLQAVNNIEQELKLTGTVVQQTPYTGLMSTDNSAPSISELKQQMILSNVPQQVVTNYISELDVGTGEALLYPYGFITQKGNKHFGYPARFDALSVSFYNTTASALGQTVQLDVIQGDDTLVSSQTATLVDGLNRIVISGGPKGVSKIPGQRLELSVSSGEIAIAVLHVEFIYSQAWQMTYAGYQVPQFDQLYKLIDRYRVIGMTTLLTDFSPNLTTSGITVVNNLRGGEPCTYNDIASPNILTEMDGSYNGQLKKGHYAVWTPYDSLDMDFAPKAQTFEGLKPYIVSASRYVWTSEGGPKSSNQYRLRFFIAFECTTHSQILTTTNSPVDLGALVAATKIVSRMRPYLITENDVHDEIYKFLTLPADTFSYSMQKVMESMDSMPPIVKDMIPLIAAFY